jgi:hypothetical protein
MVWANCRLRHCPENLKVVLRFIKLEPMATTQGTEILVARFKSILDELFAKHIKECSQTCIGELNVLSNRIEALDLKIEQLTATMTSVKAATAKPRAVAPKNGSIPVPENKADPASNVNIYFPACYKEDSEFGETFRTKYTSDKLPKELLTKANEVRAELKAFKAKVAPEPGSPEFLEYNKLHDKVIENLRVIGTNIYKEFIKDEKSTEPKQFAELFKQFKDDHKNARAAKDEQQTKNSRPEQKDVESATEDDELEQALQDDEHVEKKPAAKAPAKAPAAKPAAKAPAAKAPAKAPAAKKA